MPMVRLQLSCGCFVIAAYVERKRWTELAPTTRDGIRRRVLASHKCRKRDPLPLGLADRNVA